LTDRAIKDVDWDIVKFGKSRGGVVDLLQRLKLEPVQFSHMNYTVITNSIEEININVSKYTESIRYKDNSTLQDHTRPS